MESFAEAGDKQQRVYSECVNNQKNEFKFWAYEICPSTSNGLVSVIYYHGRIGCNPVKNIKDYKSYTLAYLDAKKKLREKTKKGYKILSKPLDWSWRLEGLKADNSYVAEIQEGEDSKDDFGDLIF